MDEIEPDRLLRTMFEAAVAATQAGEKLVAALPPPPPGRTVVVGAGKAAAAMARTVEDAWPGALSGLVVTLAIVMGSLAYAVTHIQVVA